MSTSHHSGLSSKKLTTAVMLLLALGAPSKVLGQSRGISTSLGYQHLSLDRSGLNGFFADVAVPLSGSIAIVGTADWAKQRSQAFGFDQSLTWLGASGGLRVAWGTRRAVPYGQVLVGIERGTLEIERFGDDSSSHALLQPGVGIVVRVVGRVGVLGEIHRRRVSRDEDTNGVRLAVGVRVGLR